MSASGNRTVLMDRAGQMLHVAERSTVHITAMLQDETGAAIPALVLTTLTLTLYVRDTAALTIINGVDGSNILNANQGTVHPTSGLLTLVLTPADNQIINSTSEIEWHRALIQATYNAGAKAMRYEIDFPVRNLNKVV